MYRLSIVMFHRFISFLIESIKSSRRAFSGGDKSFSRQMQD